MNKKLVYLVSISFILTFWNIETKAQQYTPFPDTNVVWKNYESAYFSENKGHAKHFDYITWGDTIISDIQYTKLFKVEYNLYCSDIADTVYMGAYRNDMPEKIVYFNQNSEEKILYNFSLDIGDTIPLTYFIETWGYELIVSDIDSVLLENGEYRKQFTYCFPLGDGTCIEGTDTYKIIEGIGFLGGLLDPMSRSAEDINTMTVCYHFNDSLYYMNEWYDKCEIAEDTCIISTIAKYKSFDKIIEIVPNPVRSSAQVLFKDPELKNDNCKLTIYNMMGREVKTYHNIQHGVPVIYRSDFNSGIYVYAFRRNNFLVKTGRIIFYP